MAADHHLPDERKIRTFHWHRFIFFYTFLHSEVFWLQDLALKLGPYLKIISVLSTALLDLQLRLELLEV